MDRSVIVKSAPRVRMALVAFLFVMLIVALIGCDSGSKKMNHYSTLPKEAEMKRKELQWDLFQIKRNIDLELTRVNDRLHDASGTTKEELRTVDRKLKSNNAKIEKALQDLQLATPENYNEVFLAVSATSNAIRTTYSRMAFEMNGGIINN